LTFSGVMAADDFRLVEEGELRHAGNPVLAMAAANAKVEMDAAGNRKLSKPHRVQSPQEKINHALALGGLQGIGKDTCSSGARARRRKRWR
jgi:hypothetical protein